VLKKKKAKRKRKSQKKRKAKKKSQKKSQKKRKEKGVVKAEKTPTVGQRLAMCRPSMHLQPYMTGVRSQL
jgi:hypothetical protein